jgi:acylphosphatase
MNGSRKGIHINISGIVQGVGFRWFVKRVAERWGVAGYVRNMYDGSVETYAEGNEIALKGFFDEVRLGPQHAHIAAVNFNWTEFQGNYKEFRIEL